MKENTEDEGTDDDDREPDIRNSPSVVNSQVEVTEEARPKKRRKVDDTSNVDMEPPDIVLVAETKEDEKNNAIRSVPLGVLPLFPLPTLPNAPSKTSLALQGLDVGLLDAEIVQPDTVLSISPGPGTDPTTKLSEKTRNRLRDLGIIELFAGKFIFYISKMLVTSV